MKLLPNYAAKAIEGKVQQAGHVNVVRFYTTELEYGKAPRTPRSWRVERNRYVPTSWQVVEVAMDGSTVEWPHEMHYDSDGKYFYAWAA
jgi:hypothetical protein